MDHASYEPMETLTSVGDLTSAHLLAAHLRAEGLDVVLQGEPLGPYPVTVGADGCDEAPRASAGPRAGA